MHHQRRLRREKGIDALHRARIMPRLQRLHNQRQRRLRRGICRQIRQRGAQGGQLLRNQRLIGK